MIFIVYKIATVLDLPGSDVLEVNLTPRFSKSNQKNTLDFKISLSISLIEDYDTPNNVSVNFEYYPLKCVNTLEYEVFEFCKTYEVERSGCIAIFFTSTESLLDAGVITNDVIPSKCC